LTGYKPGNRLEGCGKVGHAGLGLPEHISCRGKAEQINDAKDEKGEGGIGRITDQQGKLH
jgi:hypothetical protein